MTENKKCVKCKKTEHLTNFGSLTCCNDCFNDVSQ